MQEDELSCFHPIEVWKAIDLFIRIKEKEEAAAAEFQTRVLNFKHLKFCDRMNFK